jgi:6-phosphogluconate dehydrogenase
MEFEGDKAAFVDAVRDALYAAKVVSYAQGLDLMRKASDEFDWDLSLGEIAAIWRGGCIIRARFLDRITEAYGRDSKLANLMLDPFFTEVLTRCGPNWREVVATAARRGLVCPLSALRWPTSTRIAPSACSTTCCKRSATTSAPTPTSELTRTARSTPTGSACAASRPTRNRSSRFRASSGPRKFQVENKSAAST